MSLVCLGCFEFTSFVPGINKPRCVCGSTEFSDIYAFPFVLEYRKMLLAHVLAMGVPPATGVHLLGTQAPANGEVVANTGKPQITNMGHEDILCEIRMKIRTL